MPVTLAGREFASHGQHVCVSKRGPVVLVNCPVPTARGLLSVVHDPHSGVAQTRQVGRRSASDHMGISVDSQLPTHCQVSSDGEVVMRSLDRGGVETIASVFGRSITLQLLESAADDLLPPTEKLTQIVGAGRSGQADAGQVIGLWAQGSRIRDTLLLMGGKEASRPGHIAWSEEQHSQLHRLLSEELEVDSRVEDLEAKLEHTDKLAKYVMRDREDAQIERLEWWIVILLTFELALSLSQFFGKKKKKKKKHHHGEDGHKASSQQAASTQQATVQAVVATAAAGDGNGWHPRSMDK